MFKELKQAQAYLHHSHPQRVRMACLVILARFELALHLVGWPSQLFATVTHRVPCYSINTPKGHWFKERLSRTPVSSRRSALLWVMNHRKNAQLRVPEGQRLDWAYLRLEDFHLSTSLTLRWCDEIAWCRRGFRPRIAPSLKVSSLQIQKTL